MKQIFIALILMGYVFSASAQLVTNQPARLKTKVVFYEGKPNAGISGVTISPTPDAILPGNEMKDIDTSAGRESELAWSFVGRNKDKDVYHFTFTRNVQAGRSAKTTTSKDVPFDGRPITIFEDDVYTVRIETPSAEDLKTNALRNQI